MNIRFYNNTYFKLRLFVNDEKYYIDSKKELCIDSFTDSVIFRVSQCRNSEIEYLFGCKLLKFAYSFNLESSYMIKNNDSVSTIQIELLNDTKVGVRMDYYSYVYIKTNIPDVTLIEQKVYDQEKLLGDIQKTNKYEKLESIIITCWYLFKMYIFESIPLILAFFVVKRKYGIYIASYMVVAILLITFLVVSLIWAISKGMFFVIKKDKDKKRITSYKNYNSFFETEYINDVLEYGDTSHRTKDHIREK